MTEFEEIYKAYFEDVYKYLLVLSENQAVAEDLTSETFFKAMHALKKFRGDCEVLVWLCGIAKNCYLTHIKKAKRIAGDQEMLENQADDTDLMKCLEDRQAAARIHRILHSMKEPYKEIFLLRVFGELSFDEIAELFGKNAHWACVTFHRAKTQIQKELGGNA